MTDETRGGRDAKFVEDRFNAMFPGQDPAAVRDWAEEITAEGNAPDNIVDEECRAFARACGVDDDEEVARVQLMALATLSEAVAEFVANVSEHDPQECACHGGGWILSNYDTWHSCGIHNVGQPHPEDYCGGCGEHKCQCPCHLCNSQNCQGECETGLPRALHFEVQAAYHDAERRASGHRQLHRDAIFFAAGPRCLECDVARDQVLPGYTCCQSAAHHNDPFRDY